MSRLKVRFQEVSHSGTRYEISDTSWFPEQEFLRCGPVQAALVLTKKSENKIELQGTLETAVRLSCDRCLENFEMTVKSNIQLLLDCPDQSHWHVQEMECTECDLETVVLEEPAVDLGDILRQQLYLALPEKKLCKDDCKGLCVTCGINLNKKNCACAARQQESPFAVLSRLKRQ